MSHLLLCGNAYAQILRNGKGDVIALYPLSPNRMTVDRASNGRIYYTYSTSVDDNPKLKSKGQVYLKAEDVLHILGLGFDRLVGYSLIAMACKEYGAKFFVMCDSALIKTLNARMATNIFTIFYFLFYMGFQLFC